MRLMERMSNAIAAGKVEYWEQRPENLPRADLNEAFQRGHELTDQRMTCEHTKTEATKTTKDVAGLSFNYKAKRCVQCGSVLWSQDTETQFQAWLGEQRKKNPEKFVIQKVALPSSLIDFATELALKNHSTESAVYQACSSLYFVLGAARTSLAQKIEAIEPKFEGPLIQKKFRVSPKLFVKINSNARLFDLGMNEVASWVIVRVLWAANCDLEQTRIELEYVLAA